MLVSDMIHSTACTVMQKNVGGSCRVRACCWCRRAGDQRQNEAMLLKKASEQKFPNCGPRTTSGPCTSFMWSAEQLGLQKKLRIHKKVVQKCLCVLMEQIKYSTNFFILIFSVYSTAHDTC